MIKYSQLNQSRINLKDALPLPKPFTILIEPASVCNFRCYYCYYSDPHFVPKGLMKFKDFLKIAGDMADWDGDKFKVIRLIGFGEPMANKDIGKMVAVLKTLEVADRIEITSNCSMLTKKLAQQFIDAELDYLRASIYGVDNQRHKLLTRRPIDIYDIFNNIKRLRKMRDEQGKERPFIYAKLLNSTEEEHEKFTSMYTGVADEIALEYPHQWLNGDGSGDTICPQPFKMMSIRADGNVIMCDPDWQENTLVGNAFTEKLKDIWNGQKVKDFWKLQMEGRRMENKSCKNCSFITSTDYILDKLDRVSYGI